MERHGIRLDELSRVRAIDEDTEGHASNLRNNCKDFLGDISTFQSIADSFIEIFDHLSTVCIK